MHGCCGCVWPYGLHGTQSTHHRWWCLGRRARAVALAPRGGEVRVCDSTVRGLSGSSIAGRSECTAAAAVYGLAACTARRAPTTGGGAWGGGLELLLLPLEEGRPLCTIVLRQSCRSNTQLKLREVQDQHKLQACDCTLVQKSLPASWAKVRKVYKDRKWFRGRLDCFFFS